VLAVVTSKSLHHSCSSADVLLDFSERNSLLPIVPASVDVCFFWLLGDIRIATSATPD